MNITLRPTVPSDLDRLFVFQTDPEANHLAAFTPADPNNREAYLEKWTGILQRPDVQMQSILLDDQVVGSIIRFVMEGDAEISYWLDRPCWGQGIATQALRLFLKLESTRPLFGRTAFDNYGSQRVLEKAGFVRIRTEQGFANARQATIEEYVYRLDVTST